MRPSGPVPALWLALTLTPHAAGTRVPLGLDLYRPVPLTNPLIAEKNGWGARSFTNAGSRAMVRCPARRVTTRIVRSRWGA